MHKALNATVAASKSQGAKLQRIIAHLQAEHAAVNEALEEVVAERNVLKEELEKRNSNETHDNSRESALTVVGQDSQIVIEERIQALHERLLGCQTEKNNLAKYAQHLEQRLGVGTRSPTRHRTPVPAAAAALTFTFTCWT